MNSKITISRSSAASWQSSFNRMTIGPEGSANTDSCFIFPACLSRLINDQSFRNCAYRDISLKNACSRGDGLIVLLYPIRMYACMLTIYQFAVSPFVYLIMKFSSFSSEPTLYVFDRIRNSKNMKQRQSASTENTLDHLKRVFTA